MRNWLTYSGLCTCSGKTWEGSKLSPVADLDVLHKQEVQAQVGISAAWLSVKTKIPMPTEPLSKDWVTYWFQAVNEISIQSTNDHQVTKQGRQWSHTTQNTLQ